MLDEFKSAFQRNNNAHAQLIIINVVVFIVVGLITVVLTISGFKSVAEIIHNQFEIPAVFSEYLQRSWTIITYAFMHGGFLHILFNMLWLYWFGKLFVEYLGSDKLVAVYLLGALFGGLLYLLAYNTIPFFIEQTKDHYIVMVGASAAVNAIIVAAATLLPNYTFFLIIIGPVKIKYIAAIAVLLSVFGTIEGNAGGNLAHLGGALIGFIYIKQLQAGVNWGGWITVTLNWFRDLFKSNPNVKVTYRSEERTAKKPTGSPGKASQTEIDTILDKISDRGYESLTKEEKEKLFNASKK
jgi:membrane associated rhomboid family serine protease